MDFKVTSFRFLKNNVEIAFATSEGNLHIFALFRKVVFMFDLIFRAYLFSSSFFIPTQSCTK